MTAIRAASLWRARFLDTRRPSASDSAALTPPKGAAFPSGLLTGGHLSAPCVLAAEAPTGSWAGKILPTDLNRPFADGSA
jgi:hypothetical protein